MITAAALLLLVGVLTFAVIRPRGLPEAVAAVPAAGLVLALGLVPPAEAGRELRELGPTVGFLAAVLVLAHLADEAGVFDYLGARAAGWSRGSARRLLGIVFVVASVVTAALSLDATVVLLTPVLFVTAASVKVPARPHVYAATHLANSASLLLPVSNLTNLLAFAASGLTFLGFAGLMALPWLVVIAIEYVALRWFFAPDLRQESAAHADPTEDSLPAGDGALHRRHRVAPAEPSARVPRFALWTLALTLAGFALTEPLGVHPAWVACAGALVLAVREGTRTKEVLVAANAPFCLFVLALGVVVLAVRRSSFGDLVARLAPDHQTFLGLLAAAALAAVLANVLNNLPATLMLVPLVAHSPGLVLAVLIGVNVGPNLTYVGSLATLLWRQIMHERDHPPDTAEFLRLGAITVPASLVGGVAALWLGLRVGGV